jgi:hypothetical protein
MVPVAEPEPEPEPEPELELEDNSGLVMRQPTSRVEAKIKMAINREFIGNFIRYNRLLESCFSIQLLNALKH